MIWLKDAAQMMQKSAKVALMKIAIVERSASSPTHVLGRRNWLNLKECCGAEGHTSTWWSTAPSNVRAVPMMNAVKTKMA
jgi:hypothetical protein